MAKPLHKKGFPLFDDMAELVDGTRATGQYAFRAGQPTPAPPTQNAAASASASYEPAFDPVLLDMSLEGGRDSDEELDRNVRVPLDNTSLNTTVTGSAHRKLIFEREMESFISTDDEATDTQPACRISAGQGMVMLASSMEIVINSLKDMVTRAVQHTPRSEALELSAKAIKAIEMNEGFSDEDLVDAALAISNNPTVANMYLHMKNKTARKLYLLHHMEKLKRDS